MGKTWKADLTRPDQEHFNGGEDKACAQSCRGHYEQRAAALRRELTRYERENGLPVTFPEELEEGSSE